MAILQNKKIAGLLVNENGSPTELLLDYDRSIANKPIHVVDSITKLPNLPPPGHVYIVQSGNKGDEKVFIEIYISFNAIFKQIRSFIINYEYYDNGDIKTEKLEETTYTEINGGGA